MPEWRKPAGTLIAGEHIAYFLLCHKTQFVIPKSGQLLLSKVTVQNNLSRDFWFNSCLLGNTFYL